MSELRIVSSDFGYGYHYDEPLIDPANGIERHNTHTRMNNAAATAQIADYKITDLEDSVAMLLRTEEEWKRISVLMSGKDKIEHEFWSAENEINWRKLKVRANETQRVIDKTDMAGAISIHYNRTAGSLVARAKNPAAYIKFREFMLADAMLEPHTEDMAFTPQG